MSPGDDDREQARKLHEDLVDSQPFIAVSFHRRHSTTHLDMDALSDVYRALVTEASRRRLKTVFVPNMTGSGYSDDRQTANMLMANWPAEVRNSTVIQQIRSTPRVARALLARSSGLVSPRYHPMVFAFSEGVPCVGVSYDKYYDQKLSGLSALFEVRGNVHRLSDSNLQPELILQSLHDQVVPKVTQSLVNQVRAPLLSFVQQHHDSNLE